MVLHLRIIYNHIFVDLGCFWQRIIPKQSQANHFQEFGAWQTLEFDRWCNLRSRLVWLQGKQMFIVACLNFSPCSSVDIMLLYCCKHQDVDVKLRHHWDFRGAAGFIHSSNGNLHWPAGHITRSVKLFSTQFISRMTVYRPVSKLSCHVAGPFDGFIDSCVLATHWKAAVRGFVLARYLMGANWLAAMWTRT